MQVKVLAFAIASDTLGWREMIVNCTPSQSPLEIISALSPEISTKNWRVAVDCNYHAWNKAIGPLAKEIAIIPPVSGG
jgi:molybdopterin converting factor small subunit